jgi:hypothetical protein
MGEILGGLIVMALFIGFIVWKNKGKPKQTDDLQRIQEEQYWAEKDAQETRVVSADEGDSRNDD